MTERKSSDREIEEIYQHFESTLIKELPLAAWGGVVMYTLPGAAFLAALAWYEVPHQYWTPIVLLYVLATLAHLIGEGIQQLLGMMRLHSPVNYDKVQRMMAERD